MSGTFVMMMAAGARVEQPIEGQTGVWLKSGTTVISSAMTMTGVVISSGQTQYIYDRGKSLDCIFRAGAVQIVYSGGFDSGTSDYWGNGASAYISSGGTSFDRYAGGYLRVSSGAYLSSAYTHGGILYNAGTVVSTVKTTGATTFNTFGGGFSYDLYVSSGVNCAVADGRLIGVSGLPATNATFKASNGGVILNAVFESGWVITIGSRGGLVSGATLKSGCTMTISSGGSALAVTSNAGAVVTVQAGGYIEYA